MLVQMSVNNNNGLLSNVSDQGIELSNGASSSNDFSNDAEGVWSPDIDQAFHEALQIYPPCGRRKIILSDEGKMYGRNELIARYIKIRCGKTRTRKQVSSHIQVLARKKHRESQAKIKSQEINLPEAAHRAAREVAQIMERGSHSSITPSPEYCLNSNEVSPGSAPIKTEVFAPYPHTNGALSQFNIPSGVRNPLGYIKMENGGNDENVFNSKMENVKQSVDILNVKEHMIGSSKLVLCGFTAYLRNGNEKQTNLVEIPKLITEPLEVIKADVVADKFPTLLKELIAEGPSDAFFLAKCWVNFNFETPKMDAKSEAMYAVDSFYNSLFNFDISVSTKACSLGVQIIEKAEIYSPVGYDGHGVYQYRMENSPMCQYMVDLIAELKNFPDRNVVNSILENFSVLQIIKAQPSDETIMVIAFMFEVSPDPEPTCRLYRLVKD
uniref:TEA domain-containing protein n=1 Tax=Rhabditophanes sp. KR3021 TaxID=114890 RepID=A0AC35U3T2_9BILA